MKRLAKTLVLVIALATCLLLPARPGVQASPDVPITINITAEVATVDDPDMVLGGAIGVGDTITGTYTYDAATPDSNTSPTVGDYWHSSAPYGIKVEAGGFVFETDPTANSFLVEIVNDSGSPASDYYLLRSYNNLPLSNGATVDHIAWQLDDPTATALSSDALPTVPPTLADWESMSGLTLEGHDPDDPYLPTYFIRAHVTSVGEPDLVITDVWSEPPLVYYQVRNIGDGVAPEGHCAALLVDDGYEVSDCTYTPLGPGERSTSLFNYSWVCTGLEDSVVVWADYGDDVAESDEENNEREEIWPCDSAPPEILSGPTVLGLTQNEATIFWKTDEDSASVVEYGEKAGVPAYEETDSALVTEHSIGLTGLQPSTTYHFVAYSTDLSGNTGQSDDLIFETLPLPDGIDPEVSIIDPGTLEGEVTISVEAFDNIGVEKVECFVDNQLVFTDFSSASPDFGCPFDSRLFDNGEHQLRTVAHDLVGRVTEDSRPVSIYNFEDFTPPTVTIDNLSDGDTVSGVVWVRTTLHDDEGLHRLRFYVDSGPPVHSIDFAHWSPPYPQDVTLEFIWNTTIDSSNGPHTVWVSAYDGGIGHGSSDHVDVIVNNPPPPEPRLISTERRVEKVLGASFFQVTIIVENIGDAAAWNVSIEDWVRGFQPEASLGTPSSADFSTVRGIREGARTMGVMTITDPNPIGPVGDPGGNTRSYSYYAVPVLEHPYHVTPAFGDPHLRIRYSEPWPSDTWYSKEYTIPLTHTYDGQPLADAHAEAVGAANYLIVTAPYQLWVHSGQGAGGRQAVNNLLSDMALLAISSHYPAALGAVLGYMESWRPSRQDLNDLLIGRSDSDWANRLHRNFREPLEGYVLIVGETEIIPSWSDTPWGNDYSDRPYADRGGGSQAPELVVGRIIGDSLPALSNAIQTSIGVRRGWPGYGYDHSHALLISGRGTGTGDFQASVNEIKTELAQEIPAGNIYKLHWKNETDYLDAFLDRDEDRDVIFFNGHGNVDNWSPGLAAWPFYPQPRPDEDPPGPPYPPLVDFGDTNPAVFAASCLTGNYQSPDYGGIAEAFFARGAGAYIGSTENSWIQVNRPMAKYFFNRFTDHPGESIGWVLTDLERDKWRHDWSLWSPGEYRNWIDQYNLYGDPLFGSDVSAAAAAQAQEAPAEPVASLDVVVPDYEVDSVDGLDYVEIPDGSLVLVEGLYRIPYHSVDIDYPEGTKVQDVALVDRSGLVTDSGLNIPITTMQIACCGASSQPTSGQGEGWFPEEDYRWVVTENPEGSSTLLIMMYPFYYNGQTTDVRFYKNYSFDIEYTVSPVSITDLSTDKHAYEQGETVMVDLELNNSAAPQDVIVSAVVKGGASEEIVDGLLLSTLEDFTGPGSFSPQWDSSGFEPGYYYVEVTLEDPAGDLLDRRIETFRLGISSGEVTAFTATPQQFEMDDDIQVDLTFENTGTVNITGQAIIRVLDPAGDAAEEFVHDITDLMPSESIGFNDMWTASEGFYDVIGHVSFDSQTTDPATVTVQTDSDLDDFGDAVEADVGTDPLDDCPDVLGTPGLCPGPSCDGDDAWPPDVTVDRVVDIFDAITFLNAFPSAEGSLNYSQRLDLSPNGVIDVFDAITFLNHFPSACTNP